MTTIIDRSHAIRLDQQDPLREFRSRFTIPDPGLIYMDGNSLGRLSMASKERMKSAVEKEWGTDLIRGWNRGWWEAPRRIGDKIAKLVGAASGQVVVSDSTSINLFKLAASALQLLPERTKIITDTLNFPSDLYILQGLVQMLGRRHEIVRIGSRDGDITPDLSALESELDSKTALLTLSHVLFKSGYLYDMAALTKRAHEVGALVLWDLSHSVGAVPVELDNSGVDFAIGCTYKYLNGGPGSPAFLYVNKKLQEQAISPLSGWWGQASPFVFGLDYTPAPGVDRFLTGTQPILSLVAMEAALDPILDAGMVAIRHKSVLLTEYMIQLQDAILAPLGFTLGTPRNTNLRGGHVSLRHPEGYRINRVLIDEMNVIPDFREPDNIRFGLAPLYTSFEETWQAVERTRIAVKEKRYEKYLSARQTVT